MAKDDYNTMQKAKNRIYEAVNLINLINLINIVGV